LVHATQILDDLVLDDLASGFYRSGNACTAGGARAGDMHHHAGRRICKRDADRSLGFTASCPGELQFSTAVYDDNPQIICAKPVPAGKEVEMCILRAAGNKLLKLVEATADCRKP
jgi:hypothetical protein